MIDGYVLHGEIWTRNNAVNAWNLGTMGGKRSIMSLFLPKYFLVATPIGLTRKTGKGRELNRPIMNPSLTSFASNAWTVSGSFRAD